MTDTAQRFDHWSRYWANGALTSLPDDFRENYDGELVTFWFARFAELPHPAVVLDVCTGNGAVALLAARWASEQAESEISVIAVDAARLDPSAIARRWPSQAALLSRIEFRPETPLETLVMEPGSVDLICSQYGLEYCDLEQTIPRLADALKPGGELVMLAHDLTTAMVETMQAEQKEYALLESLGFIRLLKRWSDGLLDAEAIQAGLASTASALAEQPSTAGPLIAQVVQSCRALLGMPPGQLLAQKPQAAAYWSQLEAGRLRVEDMLRVNRQIGQGGQWLSLFDQAGLSLIETQPIRYQGRHHVGTARRWRKR
ncbi:MAG: class I SAM-dependent methyltransferase [Wenzhouxiangella sp.]